MAIKLPAEFVQFVEKSGVALSVADRTQPDLPLLLVNAKFEQLTGYRMGEVVGKNCRFLQPPEGAGPVKERIAQHLRGEASDEARFVIPNRRKDGTPFLNLLFLSNLSLDGEKSLILGSQFDLSRYSEHERRHYERALLQDLRDLRAFGPEFGLVVVGTFKSLASSAQIIGQTKLDHGSRST